MLFPGSGLCVPASSGRAAWCARCGASGPLLFAVPGFRAVRSCLVGPGCLVCPLRRFGPPAVCCSRVPGCAFLPRRVGLCVPASSGRAAWCAGLLVSSVVPLCTDQSCPPVTNVARNSPPHISDFEIRPLELQRFWAISKNDRVKLRAKLIWRSPRFPPRAPWPGPSPPVLATPVAMGVLHH